MIKLKSEKDFHHLLIENGYSKRGFAKASGVSPATLNKISNGKQSPRPETAKKICDTLDVEFNEIFLILEREV